MKTSTVVFKLLAVVGISVLVTGCVERRVVVREQRVVVAQPVAEVVVPEAPPAPQVEVVTVAPSLAHVWIPGYWAWQEGRWLWIGGHWERRPHPHAVWIPGGYRVRGGVRVWIGGYWR